MPDLDTVWQDGRPFIQVPGVPGWVAVARVAWIHATGAQVPYGMRVIQTCGNPRCCTIPHLALAPLDEDNYPEFITPAADLRANDEEDPAP